MKRLFLLYFLIAYTISNAQNRMDSLEKVLGQNILNPSERIDVLNDLSSEYLGNDTARFISYNNKSIRLATEENNLSGLVTARLLTAKYEQKSGNFKEALRICDDLLTFCRKQSYVNGVIKSLNKKGDLKNKVGSFEQALDLFSQAYGLALGSNDSSEFASIYNNMGISFYRIGKLDSAIYYYEAALTQRIHHADSNGVAVGMINLGGVYYKEGHFKNALKNYSSAARIADKMHNTSYLAIALNNMGLAHWRLGEYDEAIDDFNQSYELAKSINNKPTMAFCIANMAIIAHEKADYPSSLEYYLRAKEMWQDMNDSSGLGTTYYNLGLLFTDWKEDSTAYSYYLKSLEIRKAINDIDGEVSIYNALGTYYDDAGKVQKAKKSFQHAILLNEKVGNKTKAIETYLNLGNLYITTGQLDSSKYILQKGLDLANEIEAQSMQADIHSALGEYYIKKKDFNKAVTYLNKAVDYSRKNHLKELESKNLKLLSKAYSSLGHHLKAYETLVLHLSLQDSIYNQDVIRKTSRIEAKYAFQKERDSLAFAQKEEQLTFETKIEKEQTRRQWTTIILIMALLIAILMGYLLYNRQKKNRILRLQKEELDQALAVNNKFFSIISHDLRGFVLEFISISGILLHHTKQKRLDLIQNLSHNMRRSSQNTMLLLDNLLQWSISKETSFPITKTTISVNNLLIEVIELFKANAESKQISLQFETEPDLYLNADENSLKTIFRNLINNAIKFSESGSSVKINSFRDNGNITVMIQDKGVGMTAQKLSEINQLKATSDKGTKNESGVGLGMRLVMEFAERSKAHVNIASELGTGTTVKVIFASSTTTQL